MHHRLIAIIAILAFAFGGGGCESLFPTAKPKSSKKKKNKYYEEVVMPLQTGSLLQRRAFIERGPDTETKKKSKKKATVPKPEEEPAETPAPEEESTPPPERFR
jgi:hypothetical protein